MTTFDTIQNELADIIQLARNTAFQDGVISEDELALIDLIESQLKEIEDDLQGIAVMMPEDLSNEEIRKRVQLVAQDIIPNLIQKAKADGKITSEEKAILDKVMNKIV